ncbi:hypothetical protein LCGC14_1686380 [marine sediment metagenome]|uniref:Uncharacterized protein n=1 Tax=marine sediment metagenome TaxID=412755 RepID=A0A0F9K2P3_9ZZZZ
MGSLFIFNSEKELEELTKEQIIQLAKTIHEDHHKTENDRITILERDLQRFADGWFSVSAFGQRCAQATLDGESQPAYLSGYHCSFCKKEKINDNNSN